jgi:hypothetical protein
MMELTQEQKEQIRAEEVERQKVQSELKKQESEKKTNEQGKGCLIMILGFIIFAIIIHVFSK